MPRKRYSKVISGITDSVHNNRTKLICPKDANKTYLKSNSYYNHLSEVLMGSCWS